MLFLLNKNTSVKVLCWASQSLRLAALLGLAKRVSELCRNTEQGELRQ
jgi:hypothetical protein